MKTIDKLPRQILVMVAKALGHRNAEAEDSYTLAKFISDSIGD